MRRLKAKAGTLALPAPAMSLRMAPEVSESYPSASSMPCTVMPRLLA